MTVIAGPPCAGKSTYVRDNAQPGDIVVDFDRLTNALTVGGVQGQDYSVSSGWVATGARRGAIRSALALDGPDVWVIETDGDLGDWPDAEIVVLDPGQRVCLARASVERPARIVSVINEWYSRRVREFAAW